MDETALICMIEEKDFCTTKNPYHNPLLSTILADSGV